MTAKTTPQNRLAVRAQKSEESAGGFQVELALM